MIHRRPGRDRASDHRQSRSHETSRRQLLLRIVDSGASLALINNLGGLHRYIVDTIWIFLFTLFLFDL
ncbi:MAG: hypothetical protein IH891_04950 [Planctomycetes bacterium]|nr:hypothetical protein [Planctomycetota bacterium]